MSCVKLALAAFVAVVMSMAGLATMADAASTSAQGASTTKGSDTVAWRAPHVASAAGAIQTVADGNGVSSIIRLSSSSAPTSYAFPLQLPASATAQLQADGTVTVSRNGGPIGSFQAPWARDAYGKALPTAYSLTGNPDAGYILKQSINTAGAAFPVVADPHYTWGIVTGTVYFNRGETRNIATAGSSAMTPVCAGITLWFAPAGIACGLAAGDIIATAIVANNSGQCVKLKFAASGSFLGAQRYSGGYCK